MRTAASSGRVAPGGDLDQERVVIRGDHRTGVGGAGIQADAKTRRAAVHRNLAVIGGEVVFRVFGGDAALQGVPAQADVFLERNERVVVAHRAPSVTRICALTMSTPVTTSVTVCSTWMRGLTSMK
jgi:hypothetical protein